MTTTARTYPAQLIFTEEHWTYADSRRFDWPGYSNPGRVVLERGARSNVYETWTGRLLNEADAVDTQDRRNVSYYLHLDRPATRRIGHYVAKVYEIDGPADDDGQPTRAYVAVSQGKGKGGRRYTYHDTMGGAFDRLTRWAGRRFRIPA